MASITKYEGKKGITYKVTIRMKGYPTQTETFKRQTDAKRWAADTESAISQGKHFKTIEAKKHTMEELINRYIKTELPKKPKTAAGQKPQLEWWKKEIGCRTLADISPPLLVECKEKLLQEKTYKGTYRSGATANRYMAALSHVFTMACKEWGWIEVNPLTKVSREKESKGRVRFLSDDERTGLLEACKGSRNKQLYLVVMLALSTGARRNEILELTWEDVSFDQRRIILRDTKNGETRAVPLVSTAFGLLKEYSKVRRIDTAMVFPRAGIKSNQPMSIRVAWDNAVTAAKIENFHFHDLRHTCASYLAMDGASLAEISEVLGHKSLEMVKRYAHLSEQHTMGVVERMNRKIFGA
jgi:integrase